MREKGTNEPAAKIVFTQVALIACYMVPRATVRQLYRKHLAKAIQGGLEKRRRNNIVGKLVSRQGRLLNNASSFNEDQTFDHDGLKRSTTSTLGIRGLVCAKL